MIEDQFPQFYNKADEHAVEWQKRYIRSEVVQLLALLLGAALSSFSFLGQLAGVVCFAVAILAHLYRLITKADEKWWNGRAGAESAKTLCWKFVAGGEPFGIADPHAGTELAGRLTEVATEVARLLPVSVAQGHVTPEMEQQRSRNLDERVAYYQLERVRQQMGWYAGKSDDNATRARIWSSAAIGAQAIALVLGIVGAATDWDVNLMGFFAAAAASAVAWVNVKQYEVLARSYAVASNELGLIDVRITSTAWTEPAWATFVNESEEAISREHTSWRASRAV